MTAPLSSAIYEGTIRHRRFTPKHHAFTYRVFMVYLDLQELESVFQQSPWWSLNRLNIACLKSNDYLLGDAHDSLYEQVATVVNQRLGWRPQGPIRMLTNLRYFGYLINPITCYYCFNADGKTVDAIVAEVTNTPWKDRVHYVLDLRDQSCDQQRITFRKMMHVSPFQPMELDYLWRGKTPAEQLSVHIDVHRSQQSVFDATLLMKRSPMTAKNMRRILIRYPWMTGKVFVTIYWQAIKLAIKRIPFYSNPGAQH